MPGRVLVVVRFGCSSVQVARNSLCKDASILKSYNGKVCGVGEEVKVKEGVFDKGSAIILLEFESAKDANMWYSSCPAVHQNDWLGGADIIVVPSQGAAPKSNCAIELIDYKVRDSCSESFEEYKKGAEEVRKKAGGTSNVVDVKHENDIVKLRGGWDAHSLSISCWPSLGEYDKFYESDDYKPWKIRREQSTDSNIIVFHLDPLYM